MRKIICLCRRRMRPVAAVVISILTLLTVEARPPVSAESRRPMDYVDPMIGTANTGQTYPAVGVPFGMTHWTPQTQDGEAKCICPYYYKDAKIQGFRGTHWWSGSCTQDYGSVTIMPVAGDLRVAPIARASSFRHQSEKATPAYYAVTLDDFGIQAEITGTTRAGFLRFTFSRGGKSYVLVNPNLRLGEGNVSIRPDQREIAGFNPVHRIYQGSGLPAGFSGYFVARFDRPFAGYGTWLGESIHQGTKEERGKTGGLGAFAIFDAGPGDVVSVRVGTSFTSIEKARENLEKEIPAWDFKATAAGTAAIWERLLGGVQLQGGSEDQKVNFYTALYHSLLMPRIFSDHDGSYPGFDGDGKIRKTEGFDYYCDFSLWDTFRTLHPLLILLEKPARISGMIRSLLAKAEQGGWLPNFPAWNNYTSAMIGDHAVAMIVDAYRKGIRDFDVEKAYAFMWKNATRTPESYSDYIDGRGRRVLEAYLKYGYIPVEEPVKEAFHQREQSSRTLEYCYDDFVLAQLALELGRKEDYLTLMRRAGNYRNIIDPKTGFVRGRHQDGSWVEPFDPAKEQPYITEGTPWHYTWFVPHDVQGLIDILGGRQAFTAKLDTFFEKGLYWHGNEPGHQIAYLYNWAGAPWKTQNRIREILKKEYSVGPAGLSGNDDTGQMSAWYIMSSLGIYPVCPGIPVYLAGSPVFEEAKIQLGNGNTLIIRAKNVSDANRYIQSLKLAGKQISRPWLTHSEIAAGGVLEFEMGPKPNTAWGSASNAAPFSMTAHQ